MMKAKWSRAANVVWEELDGGALLIDARGGSRWTLNSTAAALWNWCDGQNSLSTLAARLAKAGRRTRNEARAEVRAFHARMSSENLLVACGGTSSAQFNKAMAFSSLHAPAAIQSLGLGHGPRTRPGPRGNSSPG